MSIEKTTTVNQREQEAKKLFGFAMSKEPHGLYSQIGKPDPSSLPSLVGNRISADYANAHRYESNANDLLLAGLGDTQTFVLNIIKLHPDISFEKALAIGRHERTTAALATIARQSQTLSSAMIKHPGDTYDLSSDKNGIEVASTITPSRRLGCPAVEYIAGSAEPWPVFRRFIPWAAELSIIAYYDHL